jgi:hypothetical protein
MCESEKRFRNSVLVLGRTHAAGGEEVVSVMSVVVCYDAISFA